MGTRMVSVSDGVFDTLQAIRKQMASATGRKVAAGEVIQWGLAELERAKTEGRGVFAALPVPMDSPEPDLPPYDPNPAPF